ncbi:MAG: hypothetical protein QM656_02410 [Paracoccaceae bacterium]
MTRAFAQIDAASPPRADAAAVFPPLFARIAAGTVAREQTRVLPQEQVGWLKDAGFGALRIPRALGGYGLDERAAFSLLIDLAAADPNIAHLFRGHFAVVEERLASPAGPVRDKWLARFGRGEIVGNASTEPGEAELGRKGTLVTQDGRGGWRLDGVKFYSTGTIFADWIDVSVTQVLPDGEVQSSILVSRHHPGVDVQDDWDGFGQKLTGTGTTRFAAVPVEAEDIQPRTDRLPYLGAVYQTVLLSVLAGISKTIVDETAGALKVRSRVYSHGNSDLARDDPQLKQVVGEIAAQSHAAVVLVQDLAARFTALGQLVHAGDRQAAAELAGPLEIAVNKVQIVVADLVLRAGSQLFNALGASAVREGTALDRHWRNARVVLSHNPVVYRARIVGDFHVNDRLPDLAWSVGVKHPQLAEAAE